MTGPVFVDTNILVYLQDGSEPAKRSCAKAWIEFLAHHRSARISFQVLLELYATLTRKLEPRFKEGEAREIVRKLSVWQPAAIDLPVLEKAWLVQQLHKLSWWDALIVAAAQTCECSTLLTEDLQHDQMIGEIRVIDPFRTPDRAPQEVLKEWERSRP
ncbi:MAG: PIN domain-containing protein [Gammaproteobacteria bacterium]|nr:PIN domain-containing protein [Gammaproteobacteria bacterium]MDE0302972.1 PIN domain-containing protein [Gammaproteobacteria bacterium]MDE0612407.1 PIN domain-containing protein [Gammaproteobacteria bacterium]